MTPVQNEKPFVVYSSRLDKEKNPFFMMEVATEFLQRTSRLGMARNNIW